MPHFYLIMRINYSKDTLHARRIYNETKIWKGKNLAPGGGALQRSQRTAHGVKYADVRVYGFPQVILKMEQTNFILITGTI